MNHDHEHNEVSALFHVHGVQSESFTLPAENERTKFCIKLEGELMATETLVINWTVGGGGGGGSTLTFKATTPVDANGAENLAPESAGVADDISVGTVSGGVPPYTVAVTAGALPSGENIVANAPNADGSQEFFQTGTPDGVSGASGSYTLTATDSIGVTTNLRRSTRVPIR